MNTQNWFSAEGIVTHFSGYATYATIWFSGYEVVAVEPHSSPNHKTGKVDYYNRIMGEELSEYRAELFEELPV